jgi:integrase
VDSFKKIGDIELMDRIDCVAAEEDKQEQEDEKNNTVITLEMETTVTTPTDPWILFLYALKAPATRDKYIERLTKFFDFLGYAGTKEEKARAFADRARTDPIYAFNCVLKFFQGKREQIDRKEMAVGTVRNYVKSIKLFCDMADLQIPWAKIARGLPRAKRFADDRAPTLQEIRKIVEYPDRRIKPVVCTMASTGIRVGAWDYLKYGAITPIERGGKVVAAKVLVYAGTPDSYVTFMTPEAYREVEAWMKFRKQCGEKISANSWLIRDLWDTEAAIRKNMHTDGVATMPKKLSSVGVKRLIERALWAQGLRKDLEEGKKRHEFATCHSLRKYFKTRCELAGVKPINIENLMGHSTGISDAYYRPNESELLDDYLKAMDSLTIDDARKLKIEVESLKADISELEQKTTRIEELERKQRQFETAFQSLIDSGIVKPYIESENNISSEKPDK